MKVKWNGRDIQPSMVTHTRNLCSTFNPSKVHTHSSEHTPWTHTWSSGQPFMLWRPGSSWGFGALLKGTSVVVLRVERALYIHFPHLQFLPARDSNWQPLDYESDSLTIRPRLPKYPHPKGLEKTPQTRSQTRIYVIFYTLTRSHSSWKVQSAMVPQVLLRVTSLPCTFSTLGLVTING